MTYFADLSPYTYYPREIIETDREFIDYRPKSARLNVGWLDAPAAFDIGPTPSWLPDALLDVIAGPAINGMRGFHECTYCPRAAGMITVDHASGPLTLGHGEIRVPAEAGTMFAAPSLIWHYVTAHGYRPPGEFIRAIRGYDRSWLTAPGPWIPEDADRVSFE
ncbi:DUF7919 family protein [Catenuloplanes japonicus]|uniref:DUF7919 family protein n=1 Tax=Catenuloplanes japonicus TaxID=33876 RepID=UPI000692259C|nr:hypothetical protein [Catenuloplanes japonicus]